METTFLVVVAAIAGLVAGSFMTVVIERVPAGRSIVRPRSTCPTCGAEIRNRDNIPLLGWLLLGGKCRDCGQRISVVYPLTELATAALVVATALRWRGHIWPIVILGALMALMPAISIIDIRYKKIPNKITYPAFVIFAVLVVLASLFDGGPKLIPALLGMALYGGGLFLLAIVSRGMGMGDAKLGFVIGLVLGSLGLRFVGVAAGGAILFGGIGGLVALIIGRSRKSTIPFGPYMAAGTVVAVLWGQQIADWYLRTFGAAGT
jgi:leader peptidase (prepilin peptidase) / N-methyltransferase